MEIAAIFGRAAMERCALLHSMSIHHMTRVFFCLLPLPRASTNRTLLTIADRTIITNVPTVDNAPPSLNYLILKLNPHLYVPSMLNPTAEEAQAHIDAMDDAIHLCSQLLRLDATKRITAAQALNEKFFANAEEGFVEEEEASNVGGEEGKCGNLHEVDAPRRGCISCFSHTARCTLCRISHQGGSSSDPRGGCG